MNMATTTTCSLATRCGLPIPRPIRIGFACLLINALQLEEDKLDIFHHAILEAQQNKLYKAPVYFRHRSEPLPSSKDGEAKTFPRRAGRQVLDLGTGTGLWAMSMAE